MKYFRGSLRMPPPSFASSHQLDDLRPEGADEQVDQEGAAEQQDRRRPRALVHEGELDVERAADREEEVEVGEGADHREEDLLDHVGAEHAGEGRAGDDRGEHQQHHEGADVRRQEAVQRHRGRVAGEHHPEARGRIRVAEDRVPRERGQRRLHGLERDARDEVGRRDLGDRVPEVREPAADVPAEQVGRGGDHDDQDRPEQQAPDVRAPARRFRCDSCVRGGHRPPLDPCSPAPAGVSGQVALRVITDLSSGGRTTMYDEHADQRQEDDEQRPAGLGPAGLVAAGEVVRQHHDQQPDPDDPGEEDEHRPHDVQERVVGLSENCEH